MPNRPTIDEFLAQNVEGYLLKDIESMKKVIPAGQVGACGYPLVLTVCAGVELLGALLSTSPFEVFKKGDRYFAAFWKVMYPEKQYAMAANAIYDLARNGLAHSFTTKGDITVWKGQGPHLVVEKSGMLHINSTTLADHFEAAYRGPFMAEFKDPSRKKEVDTRLGELWQEYAKVPQALKGLPIYVPPVPQPAETVVPAPPAGGIVPPTASYKSN